MFDKINFAKILDNINNTYDNMTEFANKSKVNRTYLSQYINQKLNAPPSPKVLLKIANNSNGVISYDDLMLICGYVEVNNDWKFIAFNSFNKLYNLKLSKSNLKLIMNNFDYYCTYIITHLKNDFIPEDKTIDNFVDFENIDKFMILHDGLVKVLKNNNLINTTIYNDLNIGNEHSYYYKKKRFFFMPTLFTFQIVDESEETINSIKRIINDFSKYVYDLFRFNCENKKENINNYVQNNEILKKDPTIFMIPIYGYISAGVPNWAEENIEGYIPVNTEIYNLSTPDECFYLKVNGESMNLKIKNGDYALIKKQDEVENGDIVAILVNGSDATLKRFKQLNEKLIILEPMSTIQEFEPLVIDLQQTPIKILGKMIGYFGKS